MLGPSTFVGLVLLGVYVVALPDVPREVAEDAGEVVVAAATCGGSLAQHAAADDATEPLVLWMQIRAGGAAPKRGAISFGQTT
jgi:hypothetical protein